MSAVVGPVLRWCGRWSSVILIAAAAAYVTADKPYDNSPPIRSDGCGYHIWHYAILKGDPTFSWYEGVPADTALHQPDPAAWRFASKYPPGVALIRLPAMVFVADPARNGLPYSPGEDWACLGVAALALVVVAAFGLDTCYRLGVGPFWANASLLLLMFGTGLFHYGTYDASFSHVYSALLVAPLVWLAVRAVQLGRPLPVWPVAALAAGLFLVRTTNVLMLGLWVLGCVVSSFGAGRRSPGLRVRAVGAAAAGFGVALAATLAVNYEMFGRLTLNTYPGEKFHWDDPHMLLVLGGERHGLFRLYPVLGVAILGGLAASRTRLATVGLVLLIGAYTVLYGHWWTWHLACGFGHRGFVDLVPFALPVLAAALGSLPRWLSWPFTLLGCLAAAYTVVQMLQYWRNHPYIPLAELIAFVTP
jgi:hypothetical protein